MVAVDPRWIEKCLTRKHAHLFGKEDGEEDGRATVGDYLEKIFQIPIWMNPIPDRQRAAVVKDLLGLTAAPQARVAAGAAPRPETDSARSGHGNAETRQPDAFREIVQEASEMPDPLSITLEEREFVERVAPLLSDKPRALKRFVNTYRLLKASLSETDRQRFVSGEPSSAHKICISQLALFTGRPRAAPRLVRQLNLASGSDNDLKSWCDSLADEDRKPFEAALGLIPDESCISVKDFSQWLPETTRYLFHRDEYAVWPAAIEGESVAPA